MCYNYRWGSHPPSSRKDEHGDDQVKHNLLTHHRPRYEDRHDNKKILKQGDFIVVTSEAHDGSPGCLHPDESGVRTTLREHVERAKKTADRAFSIKPVRKRGYLPI